MNEEKSKELVNYSFSLSEKEIEELNELLNFSKQHIEQSYRFYIDGQDYESKLESVKKFQDLFSKVEF